MKISISILILIIVFYISLSAQNKRENSLDEAIFCIEKAKRSNDKNEKIEYITQAEKILAQAKRDGYKGRKSTENNKNNIKVFPSNNVWNQDISNLKVHPKSTQFINSIGLNRSLHPDFGSFWKGKANGMQPVFVSGSQQKVFVNFLYADESDRGPYPIPENCPIEGGGDLYQGSGDRHAIIIDKDNHKLYELFNLYKLGNGRWKAGSGAIFDLKSNSLRPIGWTSADAAGLPIYPGLVRYDEVMIKKEIPHALRFTVSRSQRAFILPATHYASRRKDSNLAPMGLRVRLKADYNISGYPEPVKVILKALKKYGMIVADNGSSWYIQGAHDKRWDDGILHHIKKVKGKDFEAVYTGKTYTNYEEAKRDLKK